MVAYVPNKGRKIKANTDSVNSESPRLDIADLENGGFVAVWENWDSKQDGSGSAIKAQMFDGSGAKLGEELLVNTTAEGDQDNPQVSTLDDGGFVVTWRSFHTPWDPNYEPEVTKTQIKAQVFNADGSKRGGEVDVFHRDGVPYEGPMLGSPMITALENGRFVISWTVASAPLIINEENMYAQIFDADGSAFGNTFRVGYESHISRINWELAALADGGGDSSRHGRRMIMRAIPI